MNKNIVYLIIGVAVVVGVALFIFGKNPSIAPTGYAPTSQPPAAAPAGPAIVKAVVSRSVDASGNATGETAVFSVKTDKIVYVVLALQNVTTSTKLSYARYLNGKYIDSKVAQPSKNGVKNFYFTFEKGIGDYPKGTYVVKLYVNGRRATNVTYIFQ